MSTKTGNDAVPLPGGRRLVPIAEAAQMLARSERTLRSQISEGTIQHRRSGGSLFLLWPDDFEAEVQRMLIPVRRAA